MGKQLIRKIIEHKRLIIKIEQEPLLDFVKVF